MPVSTPPPDQHRRQFSMPVGDLPRQAPATVDIAVPHRALAIGAHPDDVDFGCGGTLAKWAEAGCQTHHVVLTDGSKGTWDEESDLAALVATRQREQRHAAAVLGSASVTFLGYIDGELASGIDERRRLCHVIRTIRPDVVVGHDPWRRYRLHPDHRHAGWLTIDAVVAARDPKFFPELGQRAHRPHTVLLFEADQPNHVERITGTLEKKIEAILAHRSQYRSTMGIDSTSDIDSQATSTSTAGFRSAVATQAAEHGALAELAAGEAFHRMADI